VQLLQHRHLELGRRHARQAGGRRVLLVLAGRQVGAIRTMLVYPAGRSNPLTSWDNPPKIADMRSKIQFYLSRLASTILKRPEDSPAFFVAGKTPIVIGVCACPSRAAPPG
jgi:hypothetical protein